MSELTRCNYCTLQDFRRVAANAVSGDRTVELRPHMRYDPKLKEHIRDGTDVILNRTWAAWMMEISNRCVCHE